MISLDTSRVGLVIAPCLLAFACGEAQSNDDEVGSLGASDVGGEVSSDSEGSGGEGSGDESSSEGQTTGSESDEEDEGGGPKFDLANVDMPSGSCYSCSSDLHEILNCEGGLVETCASDQACDSATWTCSPACEAMVNNKSSIGCEYYATEMDNDSGDDTCFAAYVANTWNDNLHIGLEYDGQALDIEAFTRVPLGFGPSLTLAGYDADAGLAPGEVAVLLLNGPGPGGSGVPCPIDPAIAQDTRIVGTGKGKSFRITTDLPAVAYQINPYGAGVGAAVAGASLLIPTSAWDTNYVAADAYQYDLAGRNPSLNIVAAEDGTTVTINPIVAVQSGGGLPSGTAGTAFEFTLDAGEHAQYSQPAELTGSVIEADKNIGLMAGHSGLRVPVGVFYADHGEQMIPPVRALGSEYVGVMHKPRGGEGAVWRLVGVADETSLTWTPEVGGPATLQQGEVVEFVTADAFVVTSQDEEHPFMLHTYMSGSQWDPIGLNGYGDADFVISVPPAQYLSSYVFYTDPSYPDSSLVIIRAKQDGQFWPVDLDCYGPLDGWQAVGDYEWTRTTLISGNYEAVGECSTGVHQIDSDAPFGLWVWGWGTPETQEYTQNRSYGYPGGMNIRPINDVILDPQG
ncbi:IgGFc-binding protein [Pseudenhygromyxa sp. WMMC2535]|uniref:IgGFc-binding protein n=1 Tax=Pseudenhygromyxa sp. WMMC2535 TaxID=2712867 RepID=UPI00155731DB|nr:IgGFc-binding protein [Pseudenhygromyxa sp. WMMC2535]NVB42957.1 IgGFc-binding protein [Pseudenhygromyxa sp. WMMC2535]